MGTDISVFIGYDGNWENLPSIIKKIESPLIKKAELKKKVLEVTYGKGSFNETPDYFIHIYKNILQITTGHRFSRFVKDDKYQKNLRDFAVAIGKHFNQPYVYYMGDQGHVYEQILDLGIFVQDDFDINKLHMILKKENALFPISLLENSDGQDNFQTAYFETI